MSVPTVRIGQRRFTIDGVSMPTVTGYETRGDYASGNIGEIVIRMVAKVEIDPTYVPGKPAASSAVETKIGHVDFGFCACGVPATRRVQGATRYRYNAQGLLSHLVGEFVSLCNNCNAPPA